ncbi:MAG: cytochrome c maturation protein CcmE [Candidatus Lokiarchaeota archaeon]
MKRNKLIAIICIVISVLVIGTLLIVNIRPYLGVTQIISSSSTYDNQEVQVIGIVQNFNGENFSLTENSYSLFVDAKATTIPPDLQNGIKIVVTGIFSSFHMALTATQILVQCS